MLGTVFADDFEQVQMLAKLVWGQIRAFVPAPALRSFSGGGFIRG